MSRRISMDAWRKLYIAYLDGETVETCARVAGISSLTATRYIKTGDPDRGLDSIERLVRANSLTMVRKLEEARLTAHEHALNAAQFLLGKQLAVLKDTEVVPTGTKLGNNKYAIDIAGVAKHTLNLRRVQQVVDAASRPVQRLAHGASAAEAQKASEQGNTKAHAESNRALLEERFRVLEQKMLSADERRLPAKERHRLLAAAVAKTRRQAGGGGSKKDARKKTHPSA